MPVPDPEDDPVILALERDEAYETAEHHRQMRVSAERGEQIQLRKVKLLLPKAYAFDAVEKVLISHEAGLSTMTDADALRVIRERLQVAHSTIERILERDPEAERMLGAMEAFGPHLG